MSCGEPKWGYPAGAMKSHVEELMGLDALKPFEMSPSAEEMQRVLKRAEEAVVEATALPEHLIDPNKMPPTEFPDGGDLYTFQEPKWEQMTISGDINAVPNFTIKTPNMNDPLLEVDKEGIKWRNEHDEYMNVVEEIKKLKAEVGELRAQQAANFSTGVPEGALAFDTDGNRVVVFDGTNWQPYDVVKSFDLTTISLVEDDTYPISESEDLKQNPLDDFDRAMKGVI